MNFIDFLDNTVEIGDLVLFTPQSRGGELVIGKLLDLTPAVRYGQRYDKETNSYTKTENHYFKPTIQPIQGNSTYRFKNFSNNGVAKVARKVTLMDTDSVMFYQKGPESE